MTLTPILAVSLALAFLMTSANAQQKSSVTTAEYGKMPDGRMVKVFTLRNKNGMEAKITEYGAILVSLSVADKDGKFSDVTHGYDDLEGWLTNTSYFGATAGRFANRIAGGEFKIDGKTHTLATNNEPGGIPCALHGGLKGFDKVLWQGTTFETGNARGVALVHISEDGTEGYPGRLSTTVGYTLNDKDELIWSCQATTDAPTILNIVHHSYWNLSGDPTQSINGHRLQLHASQFLPTNKGLIPTGKPAPVEGTPMDFTKPVRIGKRVEEDFEPLLFGGGYDHCWIVDGSGLRQHAMLHDPQSGRVMEIESDQPAIQFYGGNFLDGSATGKGGVKYAKRTALCLETENWPDAPNQKAAPNSVLRPGETYSHTMIHRFSVKK